MGILEELYYGNIQPRWEKPAAGSRCGKLESLVRRNRDRLYDTLTPTQITLFERCLESTGEYVDAKAQLAFTDGFCLAVKIMAEVMATDGIPSIDD